jgi:hypothetical protein
MAGADGASYAVWSLVDISNRLVQAPDDVYLDACADLAWESLLKPARDKLPRDGRPMAAMTYVKELPAKPLPGREYSITLGELTGTMRFYVANARIYVLLAMNIPNGPWERERFFQSFTMKPSIPMPAALDTDPSSVGLIRAGVDEGTDYNRVFSSRETTERVRILINPNRATRKARASMAFREQLSSARYSRRRGG